MKKKAFIYSTVAVALLVAAYFFFLREEKPEVQLQTAVVQTGSISRLITATGTVQPITQVQVGTQVSGVIRKIYVDYNAEVKKGQLIAELDKTSLQAAVTEAQASLSSARNELDYQQKNFDRISQLYQTKVMSQTDFETAQYTLNNAKSALAQRDSELKRARTNLGYASIYSPIDGVVLSRAVDEGQTVAASLNTPTLFTIARDLIKMQVEAEVDEADIGQVQAGQLVSFTVDAHPDDAFTGTVTQVRKEPVVESNVVTYTVIVQANNPDVKLLPGLTANISITTQQVRDVLTLTAKALRFQPDAATMQAYLEGLDQGEQASGVATAAPVGDAVQMVPTGVQGSGNTTQAATGTGNQPQTMWVKKGTAIQPVAVRTGLSDGITVEVTEGLQAGDQVVTAMEAAADETAAPTAATSSSPFMPKMPGRGNSKASTSRPVPGA